MIPMSTAISDPDWYHDWMGKEYIFKDKRSILNGLRLNPIINQGKQTTCGCPCSEKHPTACSFLQDYRKNLENIDFDAMMEGIRIFAYDYANKEGITEEPIMVLIVYEAPNNPCSERKALIDYFNCHGVECKELDYPIQKPDLKF